MALKETEPDLKILLGVETREGELFELSAMLADVSTRANFINNLINYLNRFGFDGVSFDFKYPGSGESGPEDKERFSAFLQVNWLR